MKLLVNPTGPHMYMDMNHGQVIHSHRPSVVQNSQYIQTLLAAQKIENLSVKVQDEATDEDFNKFFLESDRNVDLAVSAFLSKYEDKPEEVKAPAPETPKK